MNALPRISILKTLYTLCFDLPGRAEFLAREARGRGPFIRIPFPGRPIILVNSLSALEEILIKGATGYRKSFDYRVMAHLLGERGILVSDGAIWKADRSEIQEQFKPSFIASLEPMIREEVARSIAEIPGADRSATELPDVLAWSSRLTGRIITIKLFGRPLGDEEIDRIVRLFEMGQDQITLGITIPGPVKVLAQRLGLEKFFTRKIVAIRRELTEIVLREYRNELGSGAVGEGKSLMRLLASVVEARALSLPERERWIVDQVLTLFAAGYETTAVSISWCLHLLSLHPERQEGLEDEDALHAMVQEVLRLYPAIAMMGRENIGDTEIAGHRFPAESTFLISPFLFHHSTEFWRDPETFRPDRFRVEEDRTSLRHKYLPFGLGPRACIGQNLAFIETATALAAFTAAYRFVPVDRDRAEGTRGVPMISFRPSRKISLQLEPRLTPS